MGTRQEWGLLVLAVLIFTAGFVDNTLSRISYSHDWTCRNPHLSGKTDHETLDCDGQIDHTESNRRLLGSNQLLVGMRMDLNMAGEQDLQVLPRIGPVLAGRIVEYRAKHGKFDSLDELIQVKGIGPKTLLKIAQYLRIEKNASSNESRAE